MGIVLEQTDPAGTSCCLTGGCLLGLGLGLRLLRASGKPLMNDFFSGFSVGLCRRCGRLRRRNALEKLRHRALLLPEEPESLTGW